MSTSNKIIFQVTEFNYSPTRLDKWLAQQKLDLSRSHIAHLIDHQSITVNGRKIKSSYIVELNDQIEIIMSPVESTEILAVDIPLEIRYQDEDLLVINKPAGLVVHPAAGHHNDTLVNALLFHVKNLSMKNQNRPGIVHRIDKETSGLLVIAKRDLVHEKLTTQFKNKTTHRVYYAVVSGVIKIDHGVIETYLIRHPKDRKKYCSTREKEQGKKAVTHFEVLQRTSKMTLVKLKLETGRTHQIRIHMSEMGHPIVGDTVYGSAFKKLSRFYLHAAELGFVHPRLNSEMQFQEPWPMIDQEQIRNWGFHVE